MDMDVLHRDLLLALAAMTIESVKQQGVGPEELVGLAQGLTMAFETLFFDQAPAGETRSFDLALDLITSKPTVLSFCCACGSRMIALISALSLSTARN
jgi:hypothetical protein